MESEEWNVIEFYEKIFEECKSIEGLEIIYKEEEILEQIIILQNEYYTHNAAQNRIKFDYEVLYFLLTTLSTLDTKNYHFILQTYLNYRISEDFTQLQRNELFSTLFNTNSLEKITKIFLLVQFYNIEQFIKDKGFKTLFIRITNIYAKNEVNNIPFAIYNSLLSIISLKVKEEEIFLDIICAIFNHFHFVFNISHPQIIYNNL